MARRSRRSLLLLGVATMVVATAGSARGDTPDCLFRVDALPALLSRPGTHCLSSDLSHGGEGTAIRIAVSDVKLDLNGFTLTGTAGRASVTVGIESKGVDGVTVTNGTITGFRIGLRVAAGSGHEIRGVRAEGNWFGGLYLAGSGTMQGCQVVATGGSTIAEDLIPIAIRASADGVVVADNVVSGMVPAPGGEAVGIAVDNVLGAKVQGNVIANAAVLAQTWGIWTLARAVEVRDNLIIRFENGVAFAPPSSGIYAGNILLNVPMPGAPGVGSIRDGGNSVARTFCEPIYSLPYVISRQGSYCLVRDVSTAMATGDAILIASSDVTLDLRGFTVGGEAGPASEAIGVHAVDRRNVTVRSGNIHGFGRAVFLEDSSAELSAAGGYRVERIRADGSTSAGIHVQGRAAIVRGNQVVDTTGTGGGVGADSYGIRVEGSQARVLDNEVSGTARPAGMAYAIAVAGGRGAIVESNRVSGAAGGTSVGLGLASMLDAVAIGNRVVGTVTGIWFSGSSGVYRGNATAGVTNPYVGGTDAGGNN